MIFSNVHMPKETSTWLTGTIICPMQLPDIFWATSICYRQSNTVSYTHTKTNKPVRCYISRAATLCLLKCNEWWCHDTMSAILWLEGAWLTAFPTGCTASLPVLLGHCRLAFPTRCFMMQIPGRLHDSLQRRTVGQHDNGEFPTPTTQFWYEHASATIWWDLDLLYQSERTHCNRLQKKCHWLKEFNRRAAMNIVIPEVNGAAGPPFQEWENHDDGVPWWNAQLNQSSEASDCLVDSQFTFIVYHMLHLNSLINSLFAYWVFWGAITLALARRVLYRTIWGFVVSESNWQLRVSQCETSDDFFKFALNCCSLTRVAYKGSYAIS